jgi:hypothetical protein
VNDAAPPIVIKAALAAIPAAIVVGSLLMVATGVAAVLLGHGGLGMLQQGSS